MAINMVYVSMLYMGTAEGMGRGDGIVVVNGVDNDAITSPSPSSTLDHSIDAIGTIGERGAAGGGDVQGAGGLDDAASVDGIKEANRRIRWLSIATDFDPLVESSLPAGTSALAIELAIASGHRSLFVML